MGNQDRRLTEQATASTTLAGSANAARMNLGPYRKNLEVWYDVAAASDDLVLEVSEDGTNWRELNRIAAGSLTTGGAFMALQETTYTYARAYVGGTFADGDVNLIELSASGE